MQKWLLGEGQVLLGMLGTGTPVIARNGTVRNPGHRSEYWVPLGLVELGLQDTARNPGFS